MTTTTYVLTLSYSFNPDMERNFKPNVENGWKTIAASYKTSNMWAIIDEEIGNWIQAELDNHEINLKHVDFTAYRNRNDQGIGWTFGIQRNKGYGEIVPVWIGSVLCVAVENMGQF